ncbi:M23 family metallopeptidase [Massilia sp. R2A-15]|uniref:M23 family metallopeptidase n=1 Tax=Massilia sp. R2A-15 TaxID=3064278 RepID=UPI0027323303|nr:M23 family metallopeptidase [Massilia sp. R2A-15]WLI90750.1 M23 family metallopeptidase [Massilia sp. R2A-15]
MTLPLIVNKIRSDGPREGLSNSYGKVRNNASKWHRGWDLSAEPNSPVFAVADGVVVQSLDDVSGYGRCVVLEIKNPKFEPNSNKSFGNGNFEKLYILYAHLSQTDITDGTVKRGEQIGKTGTSGNAGGEPPHLHIEILLENKIKKSTPRLDPGELLGYELYSCGGTGLVNQEVFGSCKAN